MTKSYQKVIKTVIKKIKPKDEEKKILISVSKKVLKITNKLARKYKAKAMLAGSITRDTWLPGKKEFDVFILFPEKMKEKRLEEAGLRIGKEVSKKLNGTFKISYAQHPYVSAEIEDVKVDIVPSYAVKSAEQIKSAVDRTPFHVKYIERKLPKYASQETRLLKKFLRANSLYGADAKTNGFSGYVCELLTIKYKKFLNLARAAVKWRIGEVIDLEKHYSKKDFSKLRKTFKNQPLILIDPTDKNRNTASALSAGNFLLFKKLCSNFLQNPSEEIFFERAERPISEKELIEYQIKRKTELIVVKFSPPSVVPDILWPQLRRFGERLQTILEETRYEFKVLRKDVYTNEKDLAVVLLEMEISKLPYVQKRIGPSIFDVNDSERFLKKYSETAINGPFVEENKWVVEIPRKFLTAREKLFDSLEKSTDILKAKGIPNHIANQLTKEFEIISENSKIMELVKRDVVFGIFLRKYFRKERLV